MKRFFAAFVLWSFCNPAAFGQRINEVIEVRVVEVEVVVVDGHGKPVAGLTKGDFEIRENGKPREITNFYAVDRGQLLRDAPRSTTSEAAAEASEPPLPAPPTHIIFFIDNDHLDLRQRNRVLAAVRRFAEANVKEGVDASLITYDHEAKVRVPFTSNRARIFAAVTALEREPARLMEQVSERRSLMRRIDDKREDSQLLWREVLTYAEGQSRQLQNSLSAVSDAVKRLRGVPGRKVLVHVSSGLPLQPGLELFDYYRQAYGADASLTNMTGLQFEQSGNFRRMIADAQASGVTIDTIDAGGLTGFEGAAIDEPSGSAQLSSSLMRDNRRQGLQLIAAETGGRSVINENDFDRALVAIAADTTTYYSLGFRGEGTPSLRSVDVRVKRPGLTVHSAKRYLERTADENVRDTLESAFDFPFDGNPLGVALEIGEPHEDGSGFAVPISLIVVPGRLVALRDAVHLRCYYEVRNAGGAASALRVIDQDIAMIDERAPVAVTKVSGLRLRRGHYTLSLAVRDMLSNETSYVQRAISIP